MILYPSFWSVLSVQLYLKASHICTEWITRLDVVWRVFCFESLLLFIIPTARRVCSYPGRAGLSTMLGFEVCYLKCLAFFWNYFFCIFLFCTFLVVIFFYSFALKPLTSVWRKRDRGRRVGWTLGLKVFHCTLLPSECFWHYLQQRRSYGGVRFFKTLPPRHSVVER